MVARRTREFGIRMALGASQGHVMRAVVASALRLVGAGSIVGGIAALATTKTGRLAALRRQPADWLVLAGSGAALFTAALAASPVPAAQASRVDPVAALRTE